MKLTKTVMKPVEVFNEDVIKVGDKLKINKSDYIVKQVSENEVFVSSRNGYIKLHPSTIKEYDIEKVEETKLSKFKVGSRYKVTDRLSGDTYEAEVIKINREMVLERKSGGFTIVKESMIGNTLEFVKINESLTNEEEQRADEIYKSLENKKVNPTKEECEKKTEDYHMSLLEAFKKFGKENGINIIPMYSNVTSPLKWHVVDVKIIDDFDGWQGQTETIYTVTDGFKTKEINKYEYELMKDKGLID